MRPPYGSYNRRTLRQAARAGFPTLLLWDATASDTSRRASKRLDDQGGAQRPEQLGGGAPLRAVSHAAHPASDHRGLPRLAGSDSATVPTLLGMSSPTRTRVQRRPWHGPASLVGTSWLPPLATCPRRARLGWPSSSHAIALADGPLARCRAWAVNPLRGCARPAQDAQGPQRVPAAGLTVAGVHLEVDRALVRVLQEPGAVGLLLGADQLDRLPCPIVRPLTGGRK